MKRYIILIISLLFGVSAFSQKYKDVYESLKTMSDNEAYQILQDFSSSHKNAHAASLYKMAQILEKRLDTYDPFLQERAINQNVYNAELYISLAKLNFDEKVARQDGRYFDDVEAANPKKGPSFEEINASIAKHIEKIKNFKAIFNENRTNLYNAATKYNECISIYNEINQKNSKLRDLYFLVDKDLESKLDALKTNFDSTTYYLKKLQASLKKHPMLNYTFEYKLKPITIYRMHGLTPANFLAQTIELWDFNLWIKSFKDVYNNDITYLYKNIDETDTQNKKYVSLLEKQKIDEVPENYRVPAYLINKIYKYDYESLANSLLIYQESQINYMYQLVSYKPDTNFYAFGVNYPGNDHFTKALNYRRETDSLLTLFNQNISDEGIKKYSNIFEKKYNGETGLKEYTKKQQTYNNEVFDKAINDYANRLIKLGSWNSKNHHKMVYNGDTVFAQIVRPDKITKKGYFVHSKELADKNLILLSGTYVDKKGDHLAFVASCDTLHKIKWLKTIKQGEGSRSSYFVASVNDEIAAVVTSTAKTGAIRNFMVLFDKAGNQKQIVEIKNNSLPRKLLVDDIDNKYIVLFCGTAVKPFVNEQCDMHVCCLDSKFKTLWDKQLKFDGYACNILKTNNVYYILGAFNKMNDLDNEVVDLDGNSGLFVYSIDADGNWVNGENYETNHSIYPLWISKCNNTTFEVVSALDNNPQSDNSEIKAAYMQFSFDGKEIYNSLNNTAKR